MGGHSHFSSGAHHSSAYGVSSGSSSEDSDRVPDVTVIRAKRQGVSSSVEVASSAELLGRLTITNDRAEPVSSNNAQARSSAIDVAAVAAEAKHISSVKRLYVTTPLKDIDRVFILPFSSSVNQSEAAEQLIRTPKSCLSSILRLCDERNSEGLRSATWIPRWEYPLQRSFERAITPDKPTASPIPTLMDDGFGQVARALRDGASGPEAFALFLRLSSGHFDRVDLGAGYEQLHTFVAPNRTPFRKFSGEFRVVVSAATGTDHVLAVGTDIVLEVVRMAVNEQYPSLMPMLYPWEMATEPRPSGTLDAMWLAFQALANNKTLPLTAKNKFLPYFVVGRAVIRLVGTPTPW